jgi:AhpC/TSA antioxidant enzyme
MYQEVTNCPFPIYADPSQKLYSELGMTRTLTLGERPEYIRKSLLRGIVEGFVQGLKQVKGGLATKAGDFKQVGGEFLFEPVGGVAESPLVTPISEDGEEKQITWCHRMRKTRDHAEIPELREVLGLDGAGIPGKDRRRWSRALEIRKGTGLSGRTSVSWERTITEKLEPSTANHPKPAVANVQ